MTPHVTFFNPCGESFPSFYPLHNIKSPRALIPYVAFRRFFVHQRNFCPKTFFNITPRSLCTVLNFCSSHKIPMKPKFSWCKGLIFCFANQNLVNVLTFWLLMLSKCFWKQNNDELTGEIVQATANFLRVVTHSLFLLQSVYLPEMIHFLCLFETHCTHFRNQTFDAEAKKSHHRCLRCLLF